MIAKKDMIVTLLVSEMNTRQIYRHAKRYASLTLLKAARLSSICLAMSCLHCSKSVQYVRFYTITCVARHRSEHNTNTYTREEIRIDAAHFCRQDLSYYAVFTMQ